MKKAPVYRFPIFACGSTLMQSSLHLCGAPWVFRSARQPTIEVILQIDQCEQDQNGRRSSPICGCMTTRGVAQELDTTLTVLGIDGKAAPAPALRKAAPSQPPRHPPARRASSDALSPRALGRSASEAALRYGGSWLLHGAFVHVRAMRWAVCACNAKCALGSAA